MVDKLLKRFPKNPALFIATNVAVVLVWGACMGSVRRARVNWRETGRWDVGFDRW